MGVERMSCCGALTHVYGDAGNRKHTIGCKWNCDHPDQYLDDAIAHLGDPNWAYCYKCNNPIRKDKEGKWQLDFSHLDKQL